jgi:hypothetical protein
METDLRLSGAVAQYGRGAGMIADLASHWIGEFAQCLQSRLSEQGSPSRGDAETTSNKPMPVLGLGLKVIWKAVMRSLGRLFGHR